MGPGNLPTAGVERGATASAVIMGAMVPLVLGVAPVLVGAMVNHLGFSPSQAGLVISAHLAGIGLVGLPMTFLVQKPIWRRLLSWSIPILAGLFVVAAFVVDPAVLALALFFAGLAGGVAVSITLPIMARSASPTVAFAWWVLLQLAVGAAGVALMPPIVEGYGVRGVFLILALVMGATALLLPFIPTGPTTDDLGQARGAKPPPARASVIGLAGLYAFYVAVGAVWTYYERIGDAAGLESQWIARSLSMATLVGVVGAGAASLTPARFGRLSPLAAGLTTLLVALALLFCPLTGGLYLGSALLFKLAWTFTLPFLLSALSATDPSGRLLVLANIIIGLGLASGPAIAAGLVRPGMFSGVIALGVAGVLFCALAFFSLSALTRRVQPLR